MNHLIFVNYSYAKLCIKTIPQLYTYMELVSLELVSVLSTGKLVLTLVSEVHEPVIEEMLDGKNFNRKIEKPYNTNRKI